MAPAGEPTVDLSRYVARLLSEDVELRDGRRVQLRPIRRQDADLLVDLHQMLSPETRYLRFLSPKPRLPRKAAQYFADVDFHTRFAIVAIAAADGVDCIVAVGRFDLAPDEAVAESALVVRDDYQGVGLGTTLLGRLLDLARARGVRRLTGHVLAENHRMLELLRAHGVSAGVPEAGVVQFGIPVDDPPSLLSVLGMLARQGSAFTAGPSSFPDGASPTNRTQADARVTGTDRADAV